ncbi:MAG: acyl-CoA dehydrogenase [Micavibrio sp.]|nr:MAG: acyl-CoA dehydrogenase [Micavibrio sp.]
MSASPKKREPQNYPQETRGGNFFDTDRNLHEILERIAPDLLKDHKNRLSDFGEWVAGDLDRQAEYSDRHAPPKLETYNKHGERTGRVIFNPSYEKEHQEAYRKGAIGLAFGDDPAPHLLSFTMGYMLSQSDISVHCPVTMTGAVAYVLEHFAPDAVRDKYLPELTRMDGKTKTGGTWATELHGGSDVGATTTRAGKTGKDGKVKLNGLKWFTSNATSGLALATARPEGAPEGSKGLGLYLIPSHLDDGRENSYHIRRLKDKLGTKGLATGEIDLADTEAIEIAPPPYGLKIMMEALEYSRIHNAVGAAGAHRRAFLEQMSWASHREAFGHKIDKYPMVREQLLNTMTTLEAGTALAFEAAKAFDDALEDDAHRPWLRISTALAKYKTAEYAVQAGKNSIEMVGGNGYTEEFPTARLFRDAMVLPVWEGPANIQALELLRMVAGKENGDEVFLNKIGAIADGMPDALSYEKAALQSAQKKCKNALTYLRKNPADGQVFGRNLLDLMSDTLSAALLCEEAAHGLSRGNARKAVVARRFIDRFMEGQKIPEIGKDKHDPALKHFKELVGYGHVDPAAAGYAPANDDAAQPAPAASAKRRRKPSQRKPKR